MRKRAKIQTFRVYFHTSATKHETLISANSFLTLTYIALGNYNS